MSDDRQNRLAVPSTNNDGRIGETRRRVRFSIDVALDESLIGIISRSAREHVLGPIRPIFVAAGVEAYTPGAVTATEPQDLEALADVLRQELATLEARHARRIGKTMAFGDLLLPMGTIEVRSRRVGPRSLEIAPHHRVHWMNRLLACCPVTGEHLVNNCDACGVELGWFLAWGIGVCEHCGEIIQPSPEPMLQRIELERYRLVANLMSPIAVQRAKVMAKLAPGLSSLDPGTVAITAIQLAGTMEKASDGTADFKMIRALEASRQVPIICNAGRMLMGWPETVGEMLHDSMGAFGSDHHGFFKSWRRLKRMASEKLSGPAKSRMLLDGIPDLSDNIWNSFAAGRRTYRTTETMRVLGIDNGRVRNLADIPELVLVSKPSRYRGNRQFIADRVDDLRERKDHSINLATIGYQLDIPFYGVEQMAATALLDFRGDQAMLTAFPRKMASDDSFQDLLSALARNALKNKIPQEARSLAECVRLLGGDLKPWSAIIATLSQEKSIPFWLKGKSFTARSCLVRPEDLRTFVGLRFEENDHDFPFSRMLTKEEVAEVLTIDTPQLAASAMFLKLDFVKSGRRMQVAKHLVRPIARQIISNAEVGEHWNLAPKRVRHDKRMNGVTRVAFGWDRAQMVEANLIPGLA